MPIESTGQLAAAKSTSNGNVVVYAGSGRLNAIMVVTSATTAAITVYDNATTNSGTIIGYVPSGAAIGTFQAYDIPFANGIVLTSTAVQTLTVVYSVST
jgi:hypothetical protein